MFECDFYKKSVKGILVFTKKEGGYGYSWE
jgi:hypothetical protein